MSIAGLVGEGYDLLGDAGRIFTSPLGTTMYLNDSTVEHALNTVKSKNWRYDFGYCFEVEGTTSFSRFNLQLNPQDLQENENFAITVTPSQTGVVVEHQGFVLKQLNISGTTGLRPTDKTRTGYEEFNQLRNYFRSYAEAKKSPVNNAWKLIFRNRQDNEHWYVEPVGPGVSLRRSADKPFSYDYSISLLILGKASERIGGFSGLLGAIDTVENFIDNVSMKIDQVAGVINEATDLLKRANTQVAITLIEPLNSVNKVLKAMNYAKTTVSALPRTFYSELKSSAKETRDDLYDLFGLGDSGYNALVGRSELTSRKVMVPQDNAVLEASCNLVQLLDEILSSNILFSDKANSGQTSATSQNLDDAIVANSKAAQDTRAGSNRSLEQAFNGALSFQSPSSVKQVTLQYGETLERLAYRTMGKDATLWYQIALLNNLDPPYISETPITGKNTVKSGDQILIPLYTQADVQTTIQKDDIKLTESMSLFEKNLGIDLKLTNTNDLAYNETTKDLELIAGMENAAQAIKINLGIEPESLIYHPEKGVNLKVGQKTIYTAEEIAEAIERSLLGDVRFGSIQQLSVSRNNGTIQIGMLVKLAKLNKPVPFIMNLNK